MLSSHASCSVLARPSGQDQGPKGARRGQHLLPVNLKYFGRESCLHSGLLAVVEGVVDDPRHQRSFANTTWTIATSLQVTGCPLDSPPSDDFQLTISHLRLVRRIWPSASNAPRRRLAFPFDHVKIPCWPSVIHCGITSFLRSPCAAVEPLFIMPGIGFRYDYKRAVVSLGNIFCLQGLASALYIEQHPSTSIDGHVSCLIRALWAVAACAGTSSEKRQKSRTAGPFSHQLQRLAR